MKKDDQGESNEMDIDTMSMLMRAMRAPFVASSSIAARKAPLPSRPHLYSMAACFPKSDYHYAAIRYHCAYVSNGPKKFQMSCARKLNQFCITVYPLIKLGNVGCCYRPSRARVVASFWSGATAANSDATRHHRCT